MFHFTHKHSERETDHVVFAFHLHVPCSETVLASRLVLLVILVFVLLFFIFVLVFFFIFVLLVIMVQVAGGRGLQDEIDSFTFSKMQGERQFRSKVIPLWS